jgi:uncharacterized ubiquitin-like protein YukD
MSDNFTMPIDSSESYKVVVRILPAGEEVDMELPATTTGKLIKDSLLGHPDLNIPKFDPEGGPITYQLTSKNAGTQITDNKTLHECGVNNGDTLMLSPILKAGKLLTYKNI